MSIRIDCDAAVSECNAEIYCQSAQTLLGTLGLTMAEPPWRRRGRPLLPAAWAVVQRFPLVHQVRYLCLRGAPLGHIDRLFASPAVHQHPTG